MGKISYLERETGLEPALLCLGRLGSAIRIRPNASRTILSD